MVVQASRRTDSENSCPSPDTAVAAARWLAVLRISTGFAFLWAFLDKTFGLGRTWGVGRMWAQLPLIRRHRSAL